MPGWKRRVWWWEAGGRQRNTGSLWKLPKAREHAPKSLQDSSWPGHLDFAQ